MVLRNEKVEDTKEIKEGYKKAETPTKLTKEQYENYYDSGYLR